jgi:ketopantoate hydroxymethyltransferase
LIFLQENKEINILDSEHDTIANWISEKRGISTIIFTYSHKETFLEKLNSINITMEELIEFNKEISEDSDPEFAKAELEGVKAISENLEKLTDDSKVIILTVG